MKFLMLCATAALAIGALVACGGTSTTPAPVQSPTVAAGAATTAAPPKSAASPTAAATSAARPIALCNLLSPADLNAATGKKYEAGVLDSVGTCNWNVGPAGANRGDLIVASVLDQPLSLIKSTFAGGVPVTVSGRAAYWNPAQGLQSMWVDIGGRLLVLSFPSSRTLGPEDQAIAQKLAEIAVGKM